MDSASKEGKEGRRARIIKSLLRQLVVEATGEQHPLDPDWVVASIFDCQGPLGSLELSQDLHEWQEKECPQCQEVIVIEVSCGVHGARFETETLKLWREGGLCDHCYNGTLGAFYQAAQVVLGIPNPVSDDFGGVADWRFAQTVWAIKEGMWQPNQPVKPQASEVPSVNPNAPPIQEEPVAHRTRGGGTGRSDDGDGEAKMEDGLYPLRKVPMANPEQGPIGDVSVPLNTGDVREFKKEMGMLLEDPIGEAERLDQFLRLNIYTWVELQSILGILFTMEEREMIRHSGTRVWDRECQGPDQGIRNGLCKIQIESDKKCGLNDLVLIPEADNNLLGRDLIIALGIKITPCEGKLKIYSLTEEDNFEISDTVWYTGEAGNLNIQPISVEIQNPEIPIRVKHYPIALEGYKTPLIVTDSRLIHPVIQGRQMTAMPIDPESAAKGKPNSLMILKAKPTHTQKKGAEEMLTEHKETTLAEEMLTKFEKECEKLDAAREMLEKLEADMREHENLDYWEYRRNRDSVLIKKHESI
ncbi:hypothetical protein DUI87_26154 [Hirundo rustica rustica]|uniref:Uncharacterized protein n=1 Tax=Hirundo rustica rustica TaxID=333673 RepID=A0A3M0JF56_HIRRU|nr:hypothetical protein DUI87_26154 [Hirundo rustica rustica]